MCTRNATFWEITTMLPSGSHSSGSFVTSVLSSSVRARLSGFGSVEAIVLVSSVLVVGWKAEAAVAAQPGRRDLRVPTT